MNDLAEPTDRDDNANIMAQVLLHPQGVHSVHAWQGHLPWGPNPLPTLQHPGSPPWNARIIGRGGLGGEFYASHLD